MVNSAALVAAAVAALSFAGPAVAATPPTARTAVKGKATLTPLMALFGDTVSARVDLAVDTRFVDPDDVELRTDFRPYAVVDDRIARRRAGSIMLITRTAALRCLTPGCAPEGTRKRLPFSPVEAVWRLPGGAKRTLLLRWPELNVVTRLDLVELTGLDPREQPPWRANLSTLPGVSYRVGPRGVFWGLVALAVVLGAGGGYLVFRFFPRRAPVVVEAPPEPELPPLERALALLESARVRGSSPEQRKALELLADELLATGEPALSERARTLAWSPVSPPAESTGTLAASVRELIERSTNGRAG